MAARRMKQEADKVKKYRQPAAVKAAKPVCGTLSYLAECRGTLHKTGPTQGAAPPDGVNRMVRQ
jgi:hypothetical protein